MCFHFCTRTCVVILVIVESYIPGIANVKVIILLVHGLDMEVIVQRSQLAPYLLGLYVVGAGRRYVDALV